MSRSSKVIPEVNPDETPVVDMNFEIVPPDLGLAVGSKASIEDAFAPFFIEATKMAKELSAITSPKIAKAARLEVKRVRTAANKVREDMKREYLIMGRAIDGANKLLLSIVEPLEKSLEDIELFEARKLVAEREAWTKVRLETIQPYLDPLLPVPNLMDITDDQFESMLADAKVAHEARVERARKAEADRIAKEQEEKDRLEKLRLENERLKREAAAAAKTAADERAEAARVAAAAAELLRQERIGREAAEARANAAAAPAPTATQAPTAPPAPARSDVALTDRTKLLALAGYFKAIQIPVATTLEGGAILKQIVESRDKFVDWIHKKAKALGAPEPAKPAIDL